MELKFDLDQDELPIFMAETDEQLQVLDEGLVRLEKEGDDTELVQALFRAAHTLKGSSGMIGHKRMVTLTHALENALDGVRKQQFIVTTSFVDLCLEAVDALRLLLREVIDGQLSTVDVETLSARFSGTGLKERSASEPVQTEKAENNKTTVVEAMPKVEQEAPDASLYYLTAEIQKDSVASAARALQIVMALQEVGKIIEITPTLEVIDTAKPVNNVVAYFETFESLDKVQHRLGAISELKSCSITRVIIKAAESPKETSVEAEEAVYEEAEIQKAITKAEIPSSTDVERPSQVTQKETADKTVRTSVERLDNLMNLVAELITDRNRLYQIRSYLESTYRGDERVENLSETAAHIGRVTDQLQKEVMSIRMQPVANVFHKFPRMIRDLSNKFGKKVDLVIEGEETELDRSVIEEITDPLIHLLRNALDHGIEDAAERVKTGKSEKARILLAARHEQGRIILTVEDDGRGINAEKVKNSAVQKGLISEAEAAMMSEDEAVNLIFASGLSTARVVSDISGRGVGLDIVRNNIQRLNGSVIVETWPGKGSRFIVTLPLTLAIVPTLLVKAGPCTFAIPLVTVSETLRSSDKEIQTINNYPVIVLRNKVLPLLDLCAAFDIPSGIKSGGYHYIVVVGSGKMQMGLIVDVLMGQEEVVVKSLGPLVGEITGISSAAILGDGQVILLLDVQDLFRHAGISHER